MCDYPSYMQLDTFFNHKKYAICSYYLLASPCTVFLLHHNRPHPRPTHTHPWLNANNVNPDKTTHEQADDF